MKVRNGEPTVTANFAFSAFLFAVLGWALLETELFYLAARVRLHLIASVLGCIISAIAFRRCRLSWLPFVDVGATIEPSIPKRLHIGAAASCVALVAAGGALGVFAGTLIFAFCAGAFSLIPWSKIAFCRRHFYISCVMLSVGAALVFLAGGNRNPFSYLLGAWFLWLIALGELLIIAWNPHRSGTTPLASVKLKSSTHVTAGPQLDNLVEHQ